jgi:hypothetical protein
MHGAELATLNRVLGATAARQDLATLHAMKLSSYIFWLLLARPRPHLPTSALWIRLLTFCARRLLSGVSNTATYSVTSQRENAERINYSHRPPRTESFKALAGVNLKRVRAGILIC